MSFNNHLELAGQHAFLSPSKVNWINYTDDKLYSAYKRSFAQAIGTALHDLAYDLIMNRITLSRNDKKMVLLHLLKSGIPRIAIDMDYIFPTFMAYVNDTLANGMTPEVGLKYSNACFGHADAVGFENDKLSIFDLKTGSTPAHIEQLMIYSALFCLDNRIKPNSINTELRIYQNKEVQVVTPDPHDIYDLTQNIIKKSNFIEKISSKGV